MITVDVRDKHASKSSTDRRFLATVPAPQSGRIPPELELTINEPTIFEISLNGCWPSKDVLHRFCTWIYIACIALLFPAMSLYTGI